MMPKTAMYENNGFVFRKDNIGFAGEVFTMQTESNASRMKCGSKGKFGCSPFCPDSAHHSAFLLGGRRLHFRCIDCSMSAKPLEWLFYTLATLLWIFTGLGYFRLKFF